MSKSFQGGVDTLYNKCVNCGATPTAKSPTAISTAIQTIYTNRYNNGVTKGQNDVKNSPNSYSLYTKAQYDANYNNGVSAGKQDIRSKLTNNIVHHVKGSYYGSNITWTNNTGKNVLFMLFLTGNPMDINTYSLFTPLVNFKSDIFFNNNELTNQRSYIIIGIMNKGGTISLVRPYDIWGNPGNYNIITIDLE